MESLTVEKDIKVLYVPATSFPEGIMAAHEKLHELVPFSTDREYYGISRPENGGIAYKAAAEEMFPGEAEQLHCETMVLHKGKYVCLTLRDYRKDLPAIERTFKELLAQPGLDPQGYCVEWYLHNSHDDSGDRDMKCMIRLEDR